MRNLKSLFPDRFTGTAQELQSTVKDTIQALVVDGSYLHDIVPGSVRVASASVLLLLKFRRMTNSILPIQSLLQPASCSTSTNGARYLPATETHSEALSPNHLLR